MSPSPLILNNVLWICNLNTPTYLFIFYVNVCDHPNELGNCWSGLHLAQSFFKRIIWDLNLVQGRPYVMSIAKCYHLWLTPDCFGLPLPDAEMLQGEHLLCRLRTCHWQGMYFLETLSLFSIFIQRVALTAKALFAAMLPTYRPAKCQMHRCDQFQIFEMLHFGAINSAIDWLDAG